MPDRSGPIVQGPQDIRGLTAKFDGSSHWAKIRGDAGFITAAAGAKVGIFSRWIIQPSRRVDGKQQFRFRGQFSWLNEPLMNMVAKGTLKGRVILQGKFKNGAENVDILGWDEWRFEGGVLTLENIYQTEGVKFRPIDK